MNVDELLASYKEGGISTQELREQVRKWKSAQVSKYPLSEGQKGIWMLDKLAPGNSAYNLPVCFRFQDKIDEKLFREAIRFILVQYPILNEVVLEEEGVLYQQVQKQEKVFLKVESIAHLQEKQKMDYIKNIAKEPISLEQGPLMHVYLLEEGTQSTIVLLNIHHIVFDGTSIGILVHDLLYAYTELQRGEQPDMKQKVADYSEFVSWQQKLLKSEEGESHRQYWINQLSGELPVLELPTDAPRSKKQTFTGDTFAFTMDGALKERVIAFSRERNLTLSAFFLGIYNLLLHQYSGQNEIVVGMAGAGRPMEQFEMSIGYYINMIPIRLKISECDNFEAMAEKLQLLIMDGMDHSDYPFALMAKDLKLPRTAANSPIYQAAYYYQNFMDTDSIEYKDEFGKNIHIELLEDIHQEGENEFTLEILEKKNGFIIHLKYNQELYHKSSIGRMATNFERLVKEVIQEPQKPLKMIPLISEEEAQKLLNEWNQTAVGYNKEQCVYELFKEQVKRTPDAKAVYFEEECLTYQELDEKSSKLAVYLQNLGVKADTLVGLSLERSLYMSIALMGILKAGGAYVPLDPIYPNDRLEYMIQNSRINIVLTQHTLISKMNQLTGNSLTCIPLDDDWNQIEAAVGKGEEPLKYSGPDNLAYILYTSGSTGNPKGVMIPHKALTNFLLSMGEVPGLCSSDRLLAVTTICFDIAGLEMYLPLIKGAACYICSTEKQKNLEKLKEEIRRIKPTIMQATPATWNALFKLGWRNEERVKILCGGEALPEQLRQYFWKTNSDVYNMFGPTETTIWSTVKHITCDELVTIGTPIANTQIYILNEEKMPVPIRATGELYIGGDGLAKGYLNMPEKTKERFVDNPFQKGTKLYRTGDVARFMENGEIDFLGRMDNQVKIHGFRIELDEIETVMNKYPGIKEAVVVIHNSNGSKQLRAFYVQKENTTNKIVQKELKSYLQKWLPTYMVPSVITEIDSIPLTPNGKVNRLVLSKMQGGQTERKKQGPRAEQKNSAEIEQSILTIWKNIIGNDEIHVEDGFFEVGGDSITAVIAAEQISERLEFTLSVTDIFEYASIKELAGYITQAKSAPNKNTEPRYEAMPSETDDMEIVEGAEYPDYYKESLAVIGISCQLPGASDLCQFWENLKAGVESIHRLSKEELSKLHISEEILNNPNYVPAQSSLEGKDLFDPSFFKISPKDAQMMDPQMRLLLLHSWKAIEDAGYTPERVADTAVYMSTSNNSYQADEVTQDVRIIKDANSYVKWLFGQGGTIPTMISYQLGLKGPSYSVHSNCSSALVGMYSAFKSILSGETKYALVGASTIHSMVNAGYVYIPGLSFSSDGHIKAFDDSADGMVGGEGVAVVLVKNAANAVEDGDHIYSVIRTVQVNNDGSDKVGFYAPSIQGQASVIEKALKASKINPETISYVEAHGTGTNIGDPIELAAISSVYKKYTDKKQYCGIGSVKTNIGHLDTAAGLAGCIKIALGLEHNQIPPTINFKQINQKINLKNSPFYIVDKLTDLDNRKEPHRASLSSFGIGGTNVHVIFEQYSGEKEADTYQENKYLIPVSAKRDDRLREYLTNLQSFLMKARKESRTVSLRNLAYTLQVGRKSMESRIIFVVSSMEELLENLTAFLEGKAKSESCFVRKEGDVAESFQMLEEDEDSKMLIDSWIRKGKMDKLAFFWVNGMELDWTMLYEQGKKPNRMSLPTYPFAKESCVRKKTEIHGLTVNYAKLHPFIDENTSDFKEQKYTTVLQGNEFFLVDHVINKQEVLPGVVYIEMARAACELAMNQKPWKVKNIVWYRPIVVEESVKVDTVLTLMENEVEYHVRTLKDEEEVIHAQGRVMFSDNVNVSRYQQRFDIDACIARCQGYIGHDDFYQTNGNSVYQYGTTFRPIQEMYYSGEEVISRIQLPVERKADFARFTLHPSLLEGCLQTIVGLMGTESVTPFMPFAIEEIEMVHSFTEECYAHAVLSEESNENAGSRKYNITLYDVEGTVLAVIHNYIVRNIVAEAEETVGKKTNYDEVFYETVWEKEELDSLKEEKKENILILTDHEREILLLQDASVVLVKPAKAYHMISSQEYEINIIEQGDYEKLFAHLQAIHKFPNRIIHYCEGAKGATINDLKERSVNSIFRLTKAILRQDVKLEIELLVVYNEKSEMLPFHAAISGFAKSIYMEYPNFSCKIIQKDLDSADWFRMVKREIASDDINEIQYTHQSRRIKRLKEVELHKNTNDSMVPYRQQGVYLITGGAGALGLQVAEYLARQFKARLVLTGRSELNQRIQTAISRLEAYGAKAVYVQANIADAFDAEKAAKEAKDVFGTIHGVIHCAGVLQDNLFMDKSLQEFQQVVAPKVDGCIYLDEALREEKLDFFLLFSSISSLGNAGQTDYAYANQFLNAYAVYRNRLCSQGKRYGKTVSICWPVWEDGSMQVTEQTKQFLQSTRGIVPVQLTFGLAAMGRVLLEDYSTIYYYSGVADKIRKANAVLKKRLETVSVKEVRTTSAKQERMLFEKVRDYLLSEVSKILEAKDMGIQDDMGEYGFDSIRSTEFTNIINTHYHLDMMPTVFFQLEESTVQCLTEYFVTKYKEQLRTFYQDSLGESASSVGVKKTAESHLEQVETVRKASRFQLSEVKTYMYDNESKVSVIKQEDEDEIAVIGMDGVFPQSSNLQEFWDNIEQERNLVTKVPKERFDCDCYEDSRMHWGAFMKEIDKFDAPFFKISDKEAVVMDPQHRMFLQVVWGALEDAGYRPHELWGSDTGIFAGIGTQDYTEYLDKLEDDNPYILTGRTPFMLVNRISSMLNLHGPSEPIDTACSSSLLAVHRAAEAIRHGHCRMAIAGGVNIILTPTVHRAFSKAGMLSPSGVCRVFDKGADGTVRGEGVGAVVLKKKHDAIADGDHIYAVIKSSVENHKGKTSSLTAPNSTAETELVAAAYRKADIDPTTVGYIETHSTGTRLGDPIEINGLKQAFHNLYEESGITDTRKHCALSSLKTNMGHLEAAAGIASFIKAILALKNKKLPGMLHFKEMNPYINLDDSPLYLNLHTSDWKRVRKDVPRRAGVSAFGFGGVNVHVLLEEYTERKNVQPMNQKETEIILLSAETREGLMEEANHLLKLVDQGKYEENDLRNIAYTLQTGREEWKERLAFTADSIMELKEKLTKAVQQSKNEEHVIYRGSIERKNELLNLLANDDGIESLIKNWFEMQEYNKLLSFWVIGLKIDWNLLYGEEKPRRISLPTYPFQKFRYWVALEQNQEEQNGQKEIITTNKPVEEKVNRIKSMDVEKDIITLCTQLLSMKASDIGSNDRLEDLGMDSIVLTQLLHHIQKLDPSVDFEELYHCHTIQDIVKLVSVEEGNKAVYPELIRMNKASEKRPVFWFHGGFGGIEVYRFVAGAVERPFYGVQAKGYMSDVEPIDGIEEMASYYVQLLQSVQPKGPYELGGLSLGGLIAYEVARQLKEKGEEVKSIIMLESIFVDEEMRNDWMNLPTEKLKKDRMLRAVNLLMAFASNDNLVLISETELNLEDSDEAFLDKLVQLAIEKGDKKAPNQLKKSIVQLEKILCSLDISSTTYQVKPLSNPASTICYYFCNPEGTLFGEAESYFRLVDKGREYDYKKFSEQWRTFLPNMKVLKIEASNHLTILTEEKSKQTIVQFCRMLYDEGEVTEEELIKMSI